MAAGVIQSREQQVLSITRTFSAIQDDATNPQGTFIPAQGQVLGLNPMTPASAQLLIAFDNPTDFMPMTIGTKLPAKKKFNGFWVKRVTSSDADPAKTLFLDVAWFSDQLQYGPIPIPQVASGTASITITWLAVTGAAQLLVAARAARKSLDLQNTDPTQNMYWGPANTVTATAGANRGYKIPPGTVKTITYTGAIYLIGDVAGPGNAVAEESY